MSAATNEQRVFNPTAVLGPGAPALDFTLRSAPDQFVSLSELRGRPVILAFYPADWSPVCGDQMALYNEMFPEFRRLNAVLLDISVDGIWCHLAFAKDRKLQFPLLADFEPKGAVARIYGAYRQSDGVSERALFVIDEKGTIRWNYLSPIGVNPGAEGFSRRSKRFPPNSRCRPERETVDSGTSGSHLCAELVRMGNGARRDSLIA